MCVCGGGFHHSSSITECFHIGRLMEPRVPAVPFQRKVGRLTVLRPRGKLSYRLCTRRPDRQRRRTTSARQLYLYKIETYVNMANVNKEQEVLNYHGKRLGRFWRRRANRRLVHHTFYPTQNRLNQRQLRK